MIELQNEIKQEIDKVEDTLKGTFRYFPKFYKDFREAANQFATYREQIKSDALQVFIL